MNKVSRFLFILLFAVIACNTANSQTEDTTYIKPTDTLVLQKLSWWNDIKFGLLMHWGGPHIYSQNHLTN